MAANVANKVLLTPNPFSVAAPAPCRPPADWAKTDWQAPQLSRKAITRMRAKLDCKMDFDKGLGSRPQFSGYPLCPNQNWPNNIKRLEILMAGTNTLTFEDATFDKDVLNSEVPVLVDFWAEWCGPCRMMGPTVDQVASEYAGKVKVGKLDVDSNQQTAYRYGIRGIPTILLFKGGQIVEQKVGAIGKPEFQKMLDKHLTPDLSGAPTQVTK